MKRFRFAGAGWIATSMALSVAVWSCGSSSSTTPEEQVVDAPGDFIRSDKQRVAAPDATPIEVAELSRGNTAFAVDLYEAVRDRPGNLFYSPFSISIALAMAYAGANTNTETQMYDALRFSLDETRLHNAFNALDLALSSRGQGASGQDGEAFRMTVVNATWGQPDYPFQDRYLDVLGENYGAGLRLVDFARQPEESRVAINEWVESETEGKIEDLIPAGAIDAMTRLVLTNAIYFNAAWAFPFEQAGTAERTFNLIDGGSVSVPMMNQIAGFGYVHGGSYEAIDLPYDGQELSMLIVAPTLGHYDDVEGQLSADFIADVVAALESRAVNLTLPKFEFDADLDELRAALAGLGMTDAFDPARSDFSGIDGGYAPDLHIADVVHKAFVSVNEEGTEAAAATAVIARPTSAPVFDVELNLDRPFFFFIRDRETETVLFFGRLVNPST